MHKPLHRLKARCRDDLGQAVSVGSSLAQLIHPRPKAKLQFLHEPYALLGA